MTYQGKEDSNNLDIMVSLPILPPSLGDNKGRCLWISNFSFWLHQTKVCGIKEVHGENRTYCSVAYLLADQGRFCDSVGNEVEKTADHIS